MFSIVIIGQNAENTILDSLNSIFNQKVEFEYEVIYVDNGSMDNTRLIVDSIDNDNFMKVFLDKNVGILSARCEGFKRSKYDYILFLDSDDTFRNNFLNILKNSIENNKSDIYEFGVTPVFKNNDLDNESIARIKNYYKTSSKDISSDLIEECFLKSNIKVNVWNKLYKREIFNKVLDYVDNKFIVMEEDWVISLIVLHNCKSYCRINNSLINYSIGGGISTSRFINNETQLLKRVTAIESLNIIRNYISKEMGEYNNKIVKETIINELWKIIFRDLYSACDYKYRKLYFKEMLKYTDLNTILLNFSNILSINTFDNPNDVINRMLECDFDSPEAYLFLNNLSSKYELIQAKPKQNLSHVDINTIKDIFFNSTTWKIGSLFTYFPRKIKDNYLEVLASETKMAQHIFIPKYKKEDLYNFIALKEICLKNYCEIENIDQLLSYEYSQHEKFLYFCDCFDEDFINLLKVANANNYDLVPVIFSENSKKLNKNNFNIPTICCHDSLSRDFSMCSNIFDGIIIKSNKLRDIAKIYENNNIKILAITNQNLEDNSNKIKCIHDVDDKIDEHINWLFENDVNLFDDTVSAVIPTYNAEKEIEKLINSYKKQKNIKEIEIIIVDSGSKDKTVEISKEMGAKVIEITQEEFSHSKARNLGASATKGDYVLFTVQDALPYNRLTVSKLLGKLKKNNNAVAISPSQEGREDCDLYYERMLDIYKYDYFVNFNSEIRAYPVIENYYNIRTNTSLDDVMCLFKKDIFNKYKFKRDYAEDCDISVRISKDGYILLKTKETKVLHSHNRKASYFMKRNVIDILNIREIYPSIPVDSYDLDRLVNYVYLLYVWYCMFTKFINKSDYNYNNYNQMIINTNKICNRIEYNLERVSNIEYQKYIKKNITNDDLYFDTVKILYNELDFIRCSAHELINVTESIRGNLYHACYIIEDLNKNNVSNKKIMTEYLFKIIGEATGQAIGSYYLMNKNIDKNVDDLVSMLIKGV